MNSLATPTVPADMVERIMSASNLPSPPAVAARLIEIANDADAGVTEAVEVLRTDAALTAKLLRLANSPLYACRRQVATLQQAVTLLGLDAVLTASLSLTLISDREMIGARNLSFRAHWRRSVYSAVAAQTLANRCPSVPKPDAFLAALMQDIGVLVIGRLEPEIYRNLEAGYRHEDLIEAERSALGIDHADVGALLLGRWHLPEHIVNCVRLSHSSHLESVHPLVTIVAASGSIADAIVERPDLMLTAAETVAPLGIDHLAFSEVIADVAEVLPELASLLSAPSPPADQLAQMAVEVIVGRLVNSCAETDRLRRGLDRAQTEATTILRHSDLDPLTEALSRRALERTLDEHFTRFSRFDWPFALLFVDVDNFKTVNDTHGHQGGDEILRSTVARLTAALRDNDVIGRFGGDEFIVVLPGAGQPEGAIVAERILDRFRAEPIALRDGVFHHQTVSIGLATTDGLRPDATIADLLSMADAALYQAKHAGRDRFRAATAHDVGS